MGVYTSGKKARKHLVCQEYCVLYTAEIVSKQIYNNEQDRNKFNSARSSTNEETRLFF